MKDWSKLALVIAAVVIALGGYKYYQLNQAMTKAEAEITTLSESLANREKELSIANEEVKRLFKAYEDEKARIDGLAAAVNQVTGTAATLEKLSKTDQELLQKYSKVYFLNEHYVPAGLVLIDPRYVLKQDKPEQIHVNVKSYLEKMMADAESQGAPIRVVSGFRSFDEQASLKSNYKVIYGAGTANQFSADQGYSEHQLGTAVDVTTPDLGTSFDKFVSAPAYRWLQANAHRYGFTLSYPEKNNYYQFEPWHWRFIGVELATRLHQEGKYFYDADQRMIDEYLVKIFD